MKGFIMKSLLIIILVIVLSSCGKHENKEHIQAQKMTGTNMSPMYQLELVGDTSGRGQAVQDSFQRVNDSIQFANLHKKPDGTFVRLKDESSDYFLNAIGVQFDSILEFKWNGHQAIFVQGRVTDSLDDITLELFLADTSGDYRKYHITHLYEDGGPPSVRSLFIANADQDIEKELCVFTQWDQVHYDANGYTSELYVYDFPKSSKVDTLEYLQSISEKLAPGNSLWSKEEGVPPQQPRFKTAGEIKNELKRMGY